MTKLIGCHLPEWKRKRMWTDLIESKRSYETFKKGTSDHELAIASTDKRIYNYFLSDYAQVA